MPEGRDALTGLRDRSGFAALLRQQIGLANERRDHLALVVVDLDGFAQINMANGYAVGDRVLRHVSEQLLGVARRHDSVARIGDNRFALLLPQILNRGHVELAIQKLGRLLDAPLQIGETRIAIQFTAGAALCPEHASHAEFLLRKAEISLAMARAGGRRYAFAAAASRGLDLPELWEMEMQLESAIERGDLEMYYQPKVSIPGQETLGAEALMRWRRNDGEIISPDVFIPLAEHTRQIKKITIWALNTVLREAGEWPADRGLLSVSVNLPGELVAQPDLPELVENALHLWGREHIQLVLEITERSLMDREPSFRILQRLRDLGIKISIDDFGTGYSCLAYFKNIPADELKIDKSFVTELLTDAGSADITSLIIDLAHRFGLSVVAEGVENVATLEMLRARGCDVAQGFLFGKPMPPAAFVQWLGMHAAIEAN